MSDNAFFLRKRKDKDRRNRVASTSASASARAGPSGTAGASNAPSPASSSSKPSQSKHSASSGTPVKTEPSSDGSNAKKANLTEIKIFSSAPNTGLRFNIMRLNTGQGSMGRDVDPTEISQPVLMNRKRPGPKAPPLFATDGEGKIIGKYVYDSAGKPVLDSEGKPVIERKAEGMDMSLVGSAPDGTGGGGNRAGSRKKMKKGTKEVFHQDIEIMRLRREEAVPWVLESGRPKEKSAVPEHWVGRMQEPSALPTVLLVNDGTTEGFEMVPLGRTYRFDPERPFKALDSDAANKLYEHQAKHKIHDRWALRPEGSNNVVHADSIASGIKAERDLEQRAMRMEVGIRVRRGMDIDRKPKVERYEDDYKREGRRAERGLEGGIDEELDFDEAEEFQDDDEVNTFYRNAEEEDAAREAEEQQKKEYRLANANVGDRPQIASDDDEDDLFGEKKVLDDEGRKLKKIIRRRREDGMDEGDFSDDDETDESEAETVDSKAEDKEKEKGKDKEMDKEGKLTTNGTEDRPSRPSSRGPGGRVTSSPAGRRPNGLPTGKASTAPPGSGAALLAQRAASRGASPRPPSVGRAGSPLSGRAASPDAASGRAASPPMRGSSPVSVRGASPAPGAGVARGSSPGSAPPTRDASPAPSASGSGPGARPKSGKRKTTSESPGPSAGGLNSAQPSPSSKRKNSPAPSASAGPSEQPRPGKKSKKGSSTPTPGPEEIPSFPGMITKQDVLDWFKRSNKDTIPMSEAIAAFRGRIMNAGKNRETNQKLFLTWMKMLADQEEKMLRLKPEYR
ncbi:transcription initiation factor TFIIF subunit alpha [Kwoniella heveanensis CBS 569]|nr:transcription initiation factor TFIIF subunit alpha [Kwoniella heveanensis CBS 569]